MAEFKSLSRDTLSDQVAEQLLDYIMSEALEDGTVLPSEQRLASQFGVSRPVIREAIRSLAGQRVVHVVNGKGAVVRPLDGHLLGLYFRRVLSVQGTEAVLEVMEIRRFLEVPVARLAAERRSEEDLEALVRIVDEMAVLDARDPEYVELDVQFHLAVARAAHNTTLYHMVRSIRTALAALIGEVFRQPSQGALMKIRERSEALHRDIYEAIKRGDAAAAGESMGAHLDHALQAINDVD